MTIEKFEDIMKFVDPKWTGDNAMKGLNIIAKYFDPEETILQGADHDIIYSVGVEEIIEKGITEEDVIALRKLNWMTENESLACFV